MQASVPVPEQAFAVGKKYNLVPGRLSFTVHSSLEMTHTCIVQSPDLMFFSSELHELYEPFCLDFGPVNLNTVHEFAILVKQYWDHELLRDRELVYYCVSFIPCFMVMCCEVLD